MDDELYHYGREGMKWGKHIFGNDDDDYTVPKGLSLHRRTPSNSEDEHEKKYTYMYDYEDKDDDNFYKQFGNKVTQYTSLEDTTFAGKKTLGKSFVDKMLSLDNSDDENTLDTLDILYSDTCKRNGRKYIDDLFSAPFNPKQHQNELESIGSEMISRMVASERHDAHDEKMKKRGLRDDSTLANDMGREFVDDLLNKGYSGMRDYNDIGSSANVKTSTVLFDPDRNWKKVKSWIEDKY